MLDLCQNCVNFYNMNLKSMIFKNSLDQQQENVQDDENYCLQDKDKMEEIPIGNNNEETDKSDEDIYWRWTVVFEMCKFYGAMTLGVIFALFLTRDLIVASQKMDFHLERFCIARSCLLWLGIGIWIGIFVGMVVLPCCFVNLCCASWARSGKKSVHCHCQKKMGSRNNDAEDKKAKCSKRQLLAHVMNNIRVPFNAIVLGLGHLKAVGEREIASPDFKGKLDLVKLMLDCAETMTNVLDDVADLGQAENGLLELHIEEFDLLAVVKFLVGGLNNRLSDKQIFLDMNIEPKVESLLTRYHVLGDKHRVLQTLGIFLGNVVKFTPHKSNIQLELKWEEELVHASDHSWQEALSQPQHCLFPFDKSNADVGYEVARIVLSVKDFAEDLSKSQESSSAEIAQDARCAQLGSGMSMAKSFSAYLGGYIGLKSLDDDDTAFCLSIPYPLVEVHKHSQAVSMESSSGKHDSVDCHYVSTMETGTRDASQDSMSHNRVLVVEDTKVNRVIIRRILENLNLQCEEAVNGKEAVDYFKQGRTYDLVLMDKEMPIMDGHEATRQLRTMGVKTPIVALTGNALQSDKEMFFEAGVNDFQTKPLSREKLLQLLVRYGVGSNGKG